MAIFRPAHGQMPEEIPSQPEGISGIRQLESDTIWMPLSVKKQTWKLDRPIFNRKDVTDADILLDGDWHQEGWSEHRIPPQAPWFIIVLPWKSCTAWAVWCLDTPQVPVGRFRCSSWSRWGQEMCSLTWSLAGGSGMDLSLVFPQVSKHPWDRLAT